MRVVESFQDSEDGWKMTQGVARASLNPVLGCMIPPGLRTLAKSAQDASRNTRQRNFMRGLLFYPALFFYPRSFSRE